MKLQKSLVFGIIGTLKGSRQTHHDRRPVNSEYLRFSPSLGPFGPPESPTIRVANAGRFGGTSGVVRYVKRRWRGGPQKLIWGPQKSGPQKLSFSSNLGHFERKFAENFTIFTQIFCLFLNFSHLSESGLVRLLGAKPPKKLG